jgi:hypothetical protein
MESFKPFGDKINWPDIAEHIISLDFEVIEKHFDELLVWLQDMNWPGANIISSFLQKIGRPLVPGIKKVLNTVDDVWIYWVFNEIISKWDMDLIKEIKTELIPVAHRIDSEGNFISALKIIIKYNLVEKDEITNIIKTIKEHVKSLEELYGSFLIELKKLD